MEERRESENNLIYNNLCGNTKIRVYFIYKN